MDERWKDDEGALLNARLFHAYFGERPDEVPPPFCSDISAAWILVEALRRRYGAVELVAEPTGGWSCRIAGGADARGVESTAMSAPLAICRAAHGALARPGRGPAARVDG